MLGSVINRLVDLNDWTCGFSFPPRAMIIFLVDSFPSKSNAYSRKVIADVSPATFIT